MLESLRDPWLAEKSQHVMGGLVLLWNMIRRDPQLSAESKKDYGRQIEGTLIYAGKILSCSHGVDDSPWRDVEKIMVEGRPAYNALIERLNAAWRANSPRHQPEGRRGCCGT
ncbi:hypothetical protein ACFL2T_02045 [Elusimicrobiota bacterium]